MAFGVPDVHHWLAGDDFNAQRMNEIGTAIDWIRNPPMVHVARKLTGQSISPLNTWVKISFDTVYNSYDPYGFFNAGTPDQLTVQVPGWYMCEIQFSGSISTDTRIIIGLYKNGFTANELLFRYDQTTLPTGNNINIRKASTLFFNVGDILYSAVHCQAATFTTAVASDAELCGLRLRWVSN
jgi:hypothetical protein